MTKRMDGEPMRYGAGLPGMPKQKTKRQLRLAHGTPEEFASACNRAADDLMITTSECDAAVAEYNAEYKAAPNE